ncbi:MAG: hypothetical protein JWN72_2206 [Thermoleophilia bacterium]|nr:hypothetical protein [Thermoleophilia bacterium]
MRRMPDLPTAIALLALVALVESTPYVRIPIGLLLAIGVFADDTDVLPVVVIGSLAIALVRVGLALQARRGGDRSVPPHVAAQRAALKARLADSSTYSRITFTLAALPGVPANFLFPLIGAMRAPLGPAFLGTLLGRIPWLAITTTLFVFLGRLGSESDRDAAISLTVLAALLLITGFLGLVDWAHRAQTGSWRLRDPNAGRMTGMFTGGAAGPGGAGGFGGAGSPFGPGAFGDSRAREDDDDDVIDGEVLGEEFADDDDESDRDGLRTIDR